MPTRNKFFPMVIAALTSLTTYDDILLLDDTSELLSEFNRICVSPSGNSEKQLSVLNDTSFKYTQGPDATGGKQYGFGPFVVRIKDYGNTLSCSITSATKEVPNFNVLSDKFVQKFSLENTPNISTTVDRVIHERVNNGRREGLSLTFRITDNLNLLSYTYVTLKSDQ